MRKIYAIAIIFFIFSTISTISYADEKEKDSSKQDPQSLKSIIPPSPHISSTPVTAATIGATPVTTSRFSSGDIPSTPTVPNPLMIPKGPIQPNIPQVPLINSTVGEVLDIGKDQDETLWVDVRDRYSEQVLRIYITNLDNTHIIRQANIVRFEDIKINNTVNVIFSSYNDQNTANFISILTEEQVKMLEDESQSGQLTTSSDKDTN